MTAFRYRALDREGLENQGMLEAESERSARSLLRERGLFPVEIGTVSSSGGGRSPARRRIRDGELTLITRQWATLLSSGLTVEESLGALIAQAERGRVGELLAGVRSEILSGYSLRAALDRFPAAFPTIYRASIAAGEKSGDLAGVMEQLADYLEQRNELRGKTLQALLYPLIVAVVSLLVIIGLMTYVVPQVVGVFQQSQQSLPLLTQIMIAASDFLRAWGWALFLLLCAALAAFLSALRQEPVRRRWDAWLLGLPLIGRHLTAVEASRFASTLAILSASGVPLIAALDAGRQVLSRLPLQDAVRAATERVREGSGLARALASHKAFPPLLVHMIANGEATGRLPEMLARAARITAREVETRTTALTSLLEPLMLLLMGGLVLLIVLAVMQPIIEINTLLR